LKHLLSLPVSVMPLWRVMRGSVARENVIERSSVFPWPLPCPVVRSGICDLRHERRIQDVPAVARAKAYPVCPLPILSRIAFGAKRIGDRK